MFIYVFLHLCIYLCTGFFFWLVKGNYLNFSVFGFFFFCHYHRYHYFFIFILKWTADRTFLHLSLTTTTASEKVHTRILKSSFIICIWVLLQEGGRGRFARLKTCVTVACLVGWIFLLSWEYIFFFYKYRISKIYRMYLILCKFI